MKDTKIKGKSRHWIFNRPLLSFLLVVLFDMVLEGVLVSLLVKDRPKASDFETTMEFTAANAQNPWTSLITVLVSMLLILLFAFWFRGEYNWKKRKGWFKKGAILILPAILPALLNLVAGEGFVRGNQILLALLCGLGPGISEEVLFRGMQVPNWLRLKRSNVRQIPVIAVITSLLFAAMHLINLFVGADPVQSIKQVFYAFGLGMLFSAVYLRTGSLLWPIIIHSLIDFTAYLDIAVMGTGGILTEEAAFSILDLIPMAEGILYAVLGFYYIRPAKREEMRDLWAEKWPRREKTDNFVIAVSTAEGEKDGE